jgi:hypothetical protein
MRANRIGENMEGGFGMKTAGLSEGKDAVNPSVPFLAGCALGPLAPQHGIAQHPLGVIVGGAHPLLHEKDPKRVHLPLEATGEYARGIISFMISSYEVKEPGVEDAPFSPSGNLVGHMTQPLQLSHRPLPKPGNLGIGPLRERSGIPDEVGQAGLPQSPTHLR